MRVVCFFDANNWYHTIKGECKPSSIDIKKICELITSMNDMDVVEIRWYVSMPNRKEDELMYKKQRSFLGHLQKQGIKIISRKLQIVTLKNIRKKREVVVSKWKLCDNCRKVIEENFLNVKDGKKEKGIDVWIAIDMVRMSMKEDVDGCVLFSGDADFIPALSLVESIGKRVLSVCVRSGYSNELRQKFPYYVLKKEDLDKCLKVEK